MDIFNDLSIDNLLQAYRSESITPRELVQHILKKAEHYTDYNIWIHLLSEAEIEPYLENLQTLDPNQAPLYGIPFAIKDNIDLAGIATTAACKEFAYCAQEHAFVVEQLIAAGAIPIGKTNLDQFATGLNGTRSPYGAVKNAFDPAFISGGSSSGSAVAVALGLVSFSLGTDTAGSGRVPAAFNNLIGMKASLGLVSTRGAVPACRSLDCVTAFTLNPDDASRVFAMMACYDEQDAYARDAKTLVATPYSLATFRFAIPKADQLEFFGNAEYEKLFQDTVTKLCEAGGECVEVDFSVFLECAKLLYEGPWVAERYAAVEAFVETQADAMNPVVREIIQPARQIDAVEAFKSEYRRRDIRRAVEPLLADVDFFLTPSAPTHYRLDEMFEQPIEYNSNLGWYTNFMNLLDLAAIALPAGFTPQGLPFGVTLFVDHLHDTTLLAMAQRFCQIIGLRQAASSVEWQRTAQQIPQGYIEVAVCGAHLSGMPLNSQLTERNSQLICATHTAEKYRFYALAGGPPYRPGLIRDEQQGAAIEVEVWAMPLAAFGSFMQGIPAPLGIGSVELADGRWVNGFICEPFAIASAEEITELASWRRFIAEKTA